MDEYGVSEEDYAMVSVKNHAPVVGEEELVYSGMVNCPNDSLGQSSPHQDSPFS